MQTTHMRTALMFFVVLSLSCSPKTEVSQGSDAASESDAVTSKNAPPEQTEPEAQPDVEAIVQKVADFYQQADSFTAEIEQDMQMKMNGQEQSVSLTRAVAVQRPNNLALYSTGEMPMLDIYQNDESMVMYFSALKKYSQEEPLETFDELHANPMLSGPTLMSSMIFSLISEDPYDALMDGVNETSYLGLEELDGESVHHLRFSQDQFDWEALITADGDPLLLRVMVDMSKSLAQFAQGENVDSQMTMTETFREWTFNQPVDEEVFAFTPPTDSEKVDNIFGDMMPGEESSPLLGKSAPPVELDLLDGSSFRLEDHTDKDIVMLDFWATWCGPCVQEMPLLVEIAQEYAGKGVVFYAVNQGEEPKAIKEFLESEQLNMTVALDVEGATGNAYQVEGIPTLALIDKAGVVQAVHVGYDPGIKKTLRRELDDLLAGKNLAEEATVSQEQSESSIESFGLEEIWSAKGRFAGIAVDDEQQRIYASALRGQMTVFDTAGEQVGSFSIEGTGTKLRSAQLKDDAGIELLAFDHWGQSVSAISNEGTNLWTEDGGQGVDDVWAADLDHDGLDEVIIGYNGGTGFHVLDHDGVRRWENTDLGNVWHVNAGDVDGDGTTEVVTTSAAGQVHIFAPDGEPLNDLEVPIYANMIRVGAATEENAAQPILVVGSADGGDRMVSLNGDGETLWTLDMPGSSVSCDSLTVAPDGIWAAAGLRGGHIAVIDVIHGEIIAQISGQGRTPDVNWFHADMDATPLLLVASGSQLTAFRVTANEPESADEVDEPSEESENTVD